MYPALFPEAKSFLFSTDGFFQFEDQRVQEMIDIVREKSGKQNIIFIVDEVGQYVASRDNLILNLDGLAKNLNHLHMLFASANWLMRARAVALTG